MREQQNRLLVLTVKVEPQWTDMNGHLSVRNYAAIFSDAERVFLESIGLNREYQVERGGHVFTAETHLAFFREVLAGDRISVSVGLIDFSAKAIHLSLELQNNEGRVCAHHEALLLHVRRNHQQIPKVGAFDETILEKIKQFERHFGRIIDHGFRKTLIGIRR